MRCAVPAAATASRVAICLTLDQLELPRKLLPQLSLEMSSFSDKELYGKWRFVTTCGLVGHMKIMYLRRKTSRKSRAKRRRERALLTQVELINPGEPNELDFGLSVQWAHGFPFGFKLL